MSDSKEHHLNMLQHLIDHINLMYGIHRNDITHKIFYKNGEVIISSANKTIMKGGAGDDDDTSSDGIELGTIDKSPLKVPLSTQLSNVSTYKPPTGPTEIELRTRSPSPLQDDDDHETFGKPTVSLKEGEYSSEPVKLTSSREKIIDTPITPHGSEVISKKSSWTPLFKRDEILTFQRTKDKKIKMSSCILIVSANEPTNSEDNNPLLPIIGRQFVIDNTFPIQYTSEKYISKIQYKLKNEEGSNQSKIIFEINHTGLSLSPTEFKNKITIDNNIFSFIVSCDIENLISKNFVNYELKEDDTFQVNILECYDEFNNSLETFSKKVNECLTGNNIHITPNPQYPSVPIALMHNKFILTHVSQNKQDMVKILEAIYECIGHNSSYLKIKDMPNMSDEKVEALKNLINDDTENFYNFGDNVPEEYKYLKNITKCIKDQLINIIGNKSFHITSEGDIYTIDLKHANVLQKIQKCIQEEISKIVPGFPVTNIGESGESGATEGTGSTGAEGTSSTGAEGTGSTGAEGTGSTGAEGTGSTGAEGTSSTGAEGTGSTGAEGSGSTGAEGSGSTGAEGTSSTGAIVPDNPDLAGWKKILTDPDHPDDPKKGIFKVRPDDTTHDSILCFPGEEGGAGGGCINKDGDLVDSNGIVIIRHKKDDTELREKVDKIINPPQPLSSSTHKYDVSFEELQQLFLELEEENKAKPPTDTGTNASAKTVSDAEAKARSDAEAKARSDAEAKARSDAEAQARSDAEKENRRIQAEKKAKEKILKTRKITELEEELTKLNAKLEPSENKEKRKNELRQQIDILQNEIDQSKQTGSKTVGGTYKNPQIFKIHQGGKGPSKTKKKAKKIEAKKYRTEKIKILKELRDELNKIEELEVEEEKLRNEIIKKEKEIKDLVITENDIINAIFTPEEEQQIKDMIEAEMHRLEEEETKLKIKLIETERLQATATEEAERLAREEEEEILKADEERADEEREESARVEAERLKADEERAEVAREEAEILEQAERLKADEERAEAARAETLEAESRADRLEEAAREERLEEERLAREAESRAEAERLEAERLAREAERLAREAERLEAEILQKAELSLEEQLPKNLYITIESFNENIENKKIKLNQSDSDIKLNYIKINYQSSNNDTFTLIYYINSNQIYLSFIWNNLENELENEPFDKYIANINTKESFYNYIKNINRIELFNGRTGKIIIFVSTKENEISSDKKVQEEVQKEVQKEVQEKKDIYPPYLSVTLIDELNRDKYNLIFKKSYNKERWNYINTIEYSALTDKYKYILVIIINRESINTEIHIDLNIFKNGKPDKFAYLFSTSFEIQKSINNLSDLQNSKINLEQISYDDTNEKYIPILNISFTPLQIPLQSKLETNKVSDEENEVIAFINKNYYVLEEINKIKGENKEDEFNKQFIELFRIIDETDVNIYKKLLSLPLDSLVHVLLLSTGYEILIKPELQIDQINITDKINPPIIGEKCNNIILYTNGGGGQSDCYIISILTCYSEKYRKIEGDFYRIRIAYFIRRYIFIHLNNIDPEIIKILKSTDVLTDNQLTPINDNYNIGLITINCDESDRSKSKKDYDYFITSGNFIYYNNDKDQGKRDKTYTLLVNFYKKNGGTHFESVSIDNIFCFNFESPIIEYIKEVVNVLDSNPLADLTLIQSPCQKKISTDLGLHDLKQESISQKEKYPIEIQKLELPDTIYIYSSDELTNFEFTIEYQKLLCEKDVPNYNFSNGTKYFCLYRYINKSSNNILTIKQFNPIGENTYYVIKYFVNSYSYVSSNLTYQEIKDIIENSNKINMHNITDNKIIIISLIKIDNPERLFQPLLKDKISKVDVVNPSALESHELVSHYEYLTEVLEGTIPSIVQTINTTAQTIILNGEHLLSDIDTKTDLRRHIKSDVYDIEKLTSEKSIPKTCKIIYPTNIEIIDNYYKFNISQIKQVNLETQFIFVLRAESFEIPKSELSLNNNTIIQVASQYNFLESKYPRYSNISDYFTDNTQGPDSSLSCLSALILRDYLFRPNPTSGHTGSICEAQPIFESFNQDIYKNGYLQLFNLSDSEITSLGSQDNINKLNMLFQNSNPIYNDKTITQVFTAAPSYQDDPSLSSFNEDTFNFTISPPTNHIQNEICKKLMTAQYSSIAKFAVLKTLTNKEGPVNLHLTLVGQGAYNNAYDTLNESFEEVIKIVKDKNVRVFIHIYDPINMIHQGKKPLLENIFDIFSKENVIDKVYKPNHTNYDSNWIKHNLDRFYCTKENFMNGDILTPQHLYVNIQGGVHKELSLTTYTETKVIYNSNDNYYSLIIEILDIEKTILIDFIVKTPNSPVIYYSSKLEYKSDNMNLSNFFNWIKSTPENKIEMKYSYDMTKASNPKLLQIPENIILKIIINLSINPFPNPKGGNNSTNSKKKYTYKYMAKRGRKSRRSRKQRGGQFGASQWAPSLVGSSISEQETHLQGGILSANDTIMAETLKYQGGSRGGNIANVLAQGATPASLFAANYMYSPRKRGHKKNSHRKKHSRKHKKTNRKFRLY